MENTLSSIGVASSEPGIVLYKIKKIKDNPEHRFHKTVQQQNVFNQMVLMM